MSSHAPAHPVAPADLAAPSTVVHKFGGTSVADAERYRHVAGLLLGRPEPLQVTVVSAMKGVTDALIDLAQLAAKGDEGWREAWHALRARHRGAAVALLGEQVGETVEWIDARFDQLAEVLAALAVIILLAIAFWWWRGHTQSQQVVFGSTLKIHYEPAMAGEQRIIEYINQHIAPDYGLKLEAVGVQDPVQADRAVAEGQYAGTIYQHQWWLKQVVDANGFALSTTVPVFQWAFGIYSDRYSSVQALPNGATIVVPDDGANQGQALWLLQRIGLISLDPAVEPRTAKLKNIVGNPHQFVFKELDLLTMPRALNSVDAAIGYVSQFDAGKVPREKGILFPPAPRTFASQLVIGTPYLSQENIVKLKQAFSDPRIQTWLKTTDDPLVKDVLVPVSAE